MVYEFKAGAHIKANAQVAGEMCEKLAAEGRLTAADLVEENRPETAPLHNAFEWNNEAAAENWRLHQARHIIGSLIVKREEKEPVRAYFKIERTDTKYTHINAILKSEADTELLLKNALAELIAFRRKYNALKELVGVFNAIGELENATPPLFAGESA